ncbi:MAG: Mut7-C RNAse domain-containing protein [Desulfobacterales bacterium]
MKKPVTIRFAAESTVGKLAKWLRILGFDTVYESDVHKTDVNGFWERDRIFLTRTKRRFLDSGGFRNHIFIAADRVTDQLAEVIQTLGLVSADLRPFSLCIRCNLPIKTVGKDEVIASVPEYIWDTHYLFKSCSSCGRVYWPGSHVERSSLMINRLFNYEESDVGSFG